QASAAGDHRGWRDELPGRTARHRWRRLHDVSLAGRHRGCWLLRLVCARGPVRLAGPRVQVTDAVTVDAGSRAVPDDAPAVEDMHVGTGALHDREVLLDQQHCDAKPVERLDGPDQLLDASR